MNRVLIITSIVTAVAVLIYTVFAGLQWWAIRKQGAYASQQVGKMQGQLDAMKEQATLMDAALLESQKIAFETKRAVTVTENQSTYMKLQTDALVSQVEIMSKSFLQTGQLVEQNERAVKAAEESAKTAQESLYVGEAPYFGITNIEIIDLLVGRCPTIKITFMNGGKTPAWSFYALAAIFVAYNTDLVSERFWIQPELGNMGDTFIPAGKEKTIHYVKTDFRLTEEQDKALRGEYPQHFFVQGTAHWKTMRGDKRWIEFCGVYYSATGKFGDYYAT